MWPSLGAGRGLPSLPVLSPFLAFVSQISRYQMCPRVQDAFRVLRNEPSCPALFCPAESLCWGSSQDLLLEALLGETQGRPLYFLSPLCKGVGV